MADNKKGKGRPRETNKLWACNLTFSSKTIFFTDHVLHLQFSQLIANQDIQIHIYQLFYCLCLELEPTSFPGHQPQLDTTKLKADYNSYVTASMEAYGSNYYSLKKSKQKAAEAKSKSKKS